jgi:hypothetical protein
MADLAQARPAQMDPRRALHHENESDDAVGSAAVDDVPSVEDAELVAMVEAIRASLADIEDHLATMERSPMAKPLTLLPDHTDSACPESFAAALRERRPVKRAVVVGELKDTHGHVNWEKVDTVLASHT